MPVQIKSSAAEDIRAAHEWYESRQSGLGYRFVLELDHLLTLLDDQPRSRPFVEEPVRRALLQKFPYGVYYVAEDEYVVVLAVLDMRQHPDAWKRGF